MASQTEITKKRKRRPGATRGPLPTGVGTLIGVRLQDEQLAEIDAFRASQFEPLSRPEALRLLAEFGLDSLAKAGIRTDHLSPETREWLTAQYAEEKRRFGPMLDAKLLEAQNLRLAKGHKARERTLRSIEEARASERRSQAPK